MLWKVEAGDPTVTNYMNAIIYVNPGRFRLIWGQMTTPAPLSIIIGAETTIQSGMQLY
jgi:hypothetical protein